MRSAGSGRLSAIQATPGTISASATVSQPFSSAMVSASASAATAPVAKIAAAAALPGRGSRRLSALGRDREQRGEQQREPGKRHRLLELVDAVVERDQDRERHEHRGRRPQHRHDRGRVERPCARKPAAPNSAARPAPSVRCVP